MSQTSNEKNDDMKISTTDEETKSDVIDDAVCVCGKKFVVLKAGGCYGGNGVKCDECHKNISNSLNVYHCPVDKNNILHINGYDLCFKCFEKISSEKKKKLMEDDINIDTILFQLWFVTNKLDKSLSKTMIEKFGISSIESFISKSSHFMYNVVNSINWNNCPLFLNDNDNGNNNNNNNNNSSSNKNHRERYIELFYTKFDELRNEYLSLKNKKDIKVVYEQFDKAFQLKEKQQKQQRAHHYIYYHKSSVNNSNNAIPCTFVTPIEEEVSFLANRKEKLDEFWTKHIDVEDNSDCDIDEWVKALVNANVQLTQDEMRQFFNCINDGQSTFVDRNDYLQFMTHNFTHPDLTKYQDAIFDKIDGTTGRYFNNDNNLLNWKDDDSELDELQLLIMKQQLTSEMKAPTSLIEPLCQEFGRFGDYNSYDYEFDCYDDDGYDKNIGFSLGGAKDISSFRLNVNNHKVPDVDSITFEGIFGEYYFDTNKNNNKNKNKNKNKNDVVVAEEKTDHKVDTTETKSNESEMDDKTQDLPLFYPSYSYSKSIVPSLLWKKDKRDEKHSTSTKQKENDHNDDENKYEHFLTIGLNSNIKERDFKRKKLNLVIVLDISGSMEDTFGGDKSNCKQTKIEIARECILLLLTHLNCDDRFGLILFDTRAQVEIELNQMSSFKLSQFEKILSIKSRGGTDMECGYNAAIDMFNSNNNNNRKYIDDNLNYENRMIFLTDARPNCGATDSSSLIKLVSDAANKISNPNGRIYTTFVGIGIDFNSNLISSISNVRGCNYFSVDSKKKFREKLCDEFDYFVSPMIFNLKLSLFCEGSINGNGCIDKVFGDKNDQINVENGEIMKIITLFASPPSNKKECYEIKGGIVLIKLKNENISKNKEYFIQTQFEDKFGNKFNNLKQIKFDQILCNEKNKNSNDLSYYANLGVRKGILLVRYVLLMKEWIKSDDNDKKDYYPKSLAKFQEYFEKEMKCVDDNNLKQEIDIIDKLIHW